MDWGGVKRWCQIWIWLALSFGCRQTPAASEADERKPDHATPKGEMSNKPEGGARPTETGEGVPGYLLMPDLLSIERNAAGETWVRGAIGSTTIPEPGAGGFAISIYALDPRVLKTESAAETTLPARLLARADGGADGAFAASIVLDSLDPIVVQIGAPLADDRVAIHAFTAGMNRTALLWLAPGSVRGFLVTLGPVLAVVGPDGAPRAGMPSSASADYYWTATKVSLASDAPIRRVQLKCGEEVNWSDEASLKTYDRVVFSQPYVVSGQKRIDFAGDKADLSFRQCKWLYLETATGEMLKGDLKVGGTIASLQGIGLYSEDLRKGFPGAPFLFEHELVLTTAVD